MRSAVSLAAILGAGLLMAQEPAPKTEGARDLFFAGAAPKDPLPKIQKPTAPAAKAPAKAASGAMHLGLRYTLLLVKARGLGGEPVDPTRNFKKGECVAINLESNRSGYLYVLAKESGGNWTPLFPTPELADQDNRIDPGQVVRTPKESCFEIEDPPGAETLFVVLSRSPRDIYELEQSIKTPKAGPVTAVVAQMKAEAGTRDLPFREVMTAAPAPVKKSAAKSPASKEPLHAVYVVNGSGKASATIVTQIEIVHK
jgi:Domain of unknown function (DUF4384)